MQQVQFRSFLRHRLGERSTSSYVSNAKRVESELGIDLDASDLGEISLSKVSSSLALQGIGGSSVANCLAALRSYRVFRANGEAPKPNLDPVATPSGDQTVRADDVLAQAAREMGLDLVELIARTAIWAHPQVTRAILERTGGMAWFPRIRRLRLGETRSASSGDDRLDDNSYANLAIKLAAFGHRKLVGFHACHIWPATCYDARYHTCVANLVLVPAALAGLTDFDPRVSGALRRRAFDLTGWRPADEAEPQEPEHYPPAHVWRAPEPVTLAVRKALDRRLASVSAGRQSGAQTSPSHAVTSGSTNGATSAATRA